MSSSFMIYNKGNTTSGTIGEGTVYPSDARPTTVFSGLYEILFL
jgi:hypothetical protein